MGLEQRLRGIATCGCDEDSAAHLGREAADALEKLRGYAGHTEECDIMAVGVWSDPIPCTCGFTALLKDLSA